MPAKKSAPVAPLAIRTATPSSVRAVNRSIMLELIRRHQPVSRADLARLTGVFRSSVSEIIDELLRENLLFEERDTGRRSRGRVPMSLRLNEASHHVLGLNIRPSYCQLAYAGLSGRIQNSVTFETPTSPKKLVRAITNAIRTIPVNGSGRNNGGFQRIGIAVPGHVNALTGRVLWIPTHTELTGFCIAEEVQAQTGIDTIADNDCNAGALSELWLSTERKRHRNTDFIFLNVSDFGTGAGVVIDGETYLGHNAHFAAEMGHMVVEPAGRVCTCGRRGCWELYVSNEATWRRVHPRTPFTAEAFEGLLAAAQRGDRACLKSVHETARYLSLGISNIGFAFNPAEVVIAGRITAVWDLIRDDLTTVYGCGHLRYVVRPAQLSADDSLLHGAVCLALRATFAGPKFGQN